MRASRGCSGNARSCSCDRRVKRVEQRQTGVDPILGRPLEPGERPRIAAPGEDVEQRRREIDAAHIRLAMRTKDVARIPQTNRASGARASRAAGALLRRIGRDPLDDEMIDRRLRIEAQHLVHAGVDDVRDAFDRQRRLRDVRGQDHLAPIRRRERALLRIDVERAMQRKDERIDIRQLAARPLDLAHAGQEDRGCRPPHRATARGLRRTSKRPVCTERRPEIAARRRRRLARRRESAETSSAAMVADITTTARSSRESMACFASASATSA